MGETNRSRNHAYIKKSNAIRETMKQISTMESLWHHRIRFMIKLLWVIFFLLGTYNLIYPGSVTRAFNDATGLIAAGM